MAAEPAHPGAVAGRAPLPDALWSGHGDRLLFILRPPAPVHDGLVQSLERIAMLGVLTDRWPAPCWHQSLSGRYRDTPAIREPMKAAGARVQAAGFGIELDRVDITEGGHARFRACRSNRPLEQLVRQLGTALTDEGLPWLHGHTPHITLNYRYAGAPQPGRPAPRVQWQADAFELVAGGGTPYRYTTLARWPLAPAPATAVQFQLFS